MVDTPTLQTEMETGKLLDVRAVGFLNRTIGPDNWGQETLLLADWDVIESAIAQTRPSLEGGVLEDAVIQYVALFNAGGAPPPIIAHKPKGGPKFRTLDGHQRCTAATKVGKADIIAYVVRVDDRETLDFLAMTANDAINGRRNTPLDKQRQVEYVLETYPHLSNKEIARRLEVSESSVSDVKNIRKTKERLDTLKVGYQGVDNTVIKLFGPIADDAVLVKAVEIAADKRLTTAQAADLVAQVKDGRSEADRLEKVEAYAKSPAINAQGHRANQGAKSDGGSVRRAARPYWVRMIDEGQRFNHRLTGAPVDASPENLETLKSLGVSIMGNIQRLTGSLNGTVGVGAVAVTSKK